MFYEVAIQKSPSGFGEYECQPANGEGWVDADDLLQEITSNYDVFELTDEVSTALPERVEDIRGRIHNEPWRIFAIVMDTQVSYFGIVET